jgi:hypothetical protein
MIMPSLIIVHGPYGISAILIPHRVDSIQLQLIHALAIGGGLQPTDPATNRRWKIWGAYTRPGYAPDQRPTGTTLLFTKA